MYRLSIQPSAVKSLPKHRLATICQLYTNRSLAYFQLGKFDKSVEDADYVITALDTKNSKGYFRRGMAYAKMGKKDKAVADLREAMKLEPENELYANELSTIKMGK